MLNKIINAEELVRRADKLFQSENPEQQKDFLENNFDITFDEAKNIHDQLSKVGQELNVQFSFTFLKNDDYNAREHALFDLLCDRLYRSIEISNYATVTTTPIISEKQITVHFRSLFSPAGKILFDIFPCGNSQNTKEYGEIEHPMSFYITKDKRASRITAEFYNFFTTYRRRIKNISFHYGMSAGHVIKADDGHAKIEKGAYFKEDAFAMAAHTINALNQNLYNFYVRDKLIGENLDYNRDIEKTPDGTIRVSSAYEHFCEPGTINELSRLTRTDLLLDIGHAIITLKNLYNRDPALVDIEEYMIRMLGRIQIDNTSLPNYPTIREVHFVVPSYIRIEEKDLLYHTDQNWAFRDYHASFVERKDDTYTAQLNVPFIREKEYRLAIDALKFLVSQRNSNFPNAEPLIINIETAHDKRNIPEELKLLAGELTSLLP